MNKYTLFTKGIRWKTIVFIIYSILLGIAVARHEPWFDEAQAWLLARDASFVDLMVTYLRYEGSPGLWHVLLMIPAKLGLPYFSLNIISALLAFVGSYLFLRYSPFPLVIKLLYPFTYFAFYQYGVVARSYSLIPVLLFTIAILYKEKTSRPFLFSCLLILLANVSFHGVIIALSLALIHMFHINGKWSLVSKRTKYFNLLAFLFFGLVIYLIKLQLELPKDIISVAGIKKDISHLLDKCIPVLFNAISVSGPGNLSEYPIITNLSRVFSIFTIGLTVFWLLLRQKLLLFILPTAALFVFFTMVYVHAWHTGVLFFTWIFALWVSFEGSETERNNLSHITKSSIIYTLAVIFLIQSYWSLMSFNSDYSQNYSASREVANYIKENQLKDKKIYATNFHSISILPYFQSNIFCNYNNNKPPSFWIWSHKNSMYNEPYLSTAKYNPDIIILGLKDYRPKALNTNNTFIPDIPGYKFLKLFSGALFWKTGLLETDSFALFKKVK